MCGARQKSINGFPSVRQSPSLAGLFVLCFCSRWTSRLSWRGMSNGGDREEIIADTRSDLRSHGRGAGSKLHNSAQPKARLHRARKRRGCRPTDPRTTADLHDPARQWLVCCSGANAYLRHPTGQRHLRDSIARTSAPIPHPHALILHLLQQTRVRCPAGIFHCGLSRDRH